MTSTKRSSFHREEKHQHLPHQSQGDHQESKTSHLNLDGIEMSTHQNLDLILQLLCLQAMLGRHLLVNWIQRLKLWIFPKTFNCNIIICFLLMSIE